MSDFVSLLDIVENSSYDGLRRLRDEVAEMDLLLRRAMDRGLTTDEMEKAQASRTAVQAASRILEHIVK